MATVAGNASLTCSGGFAPPESPEGLEAEDRRRGLTFPFPAVVVQQALLAHRPYGNCSIVGRLF
jgi:hypothetical protein